MPSQRRRDAGFLEMGNKVPIVCAVPCGAHHSIRLIGHQDFGAYYELLWRKFSFHGLDDPASGVGGGAVTASGIMSMMLFPMVHATSQIMANCSLVKDTLTISPGGLTSLPMAQDHLMYTTWFNKRNRILPRQSTPDKVAVKAQDDQLMSRRLVTLGSRVAASLRHHAPGHELLVSLLFEYLCGGSSTLLKLRTTMLS
jgi:hypothetical protein